MKKNKDIEFINQYIHQSIPVSKELGFQVTDFTDDSICLEAPFDKNKNDKNTGFAGSIYSIAVLSGWALVFMRLRKQGFRANVAIKKSEIQYHKPITKNFKSISQLDSFDEWDIFIEKLKLKKKSGIHVQVHLIEDGIKKVTLDGVYAAWVD